MKRQRPHRAQRGHDGDGSDGNVTFTGSVAAINLALELKPKHVVPIHDWHWSDAAREQMYDRLEQILGEQGITFHKLQTGQPVNIDAS